ncbi:Phosphoenolpyruvate-protein phosphotransferase of PTS system [Pseudonocardia sp. Ae168_Ps1]|uniref:putative PEP-binding protein n=1 Tax=unclassified Pseudonocardia TaxID=2619320 RepID=UPI00094B2271|nr:MULTISPECIES: putative PEP-binding protein [unclassified Pseudonocardia]OLL74743.1 Phosphoenolpyruvate-protein phosphotransferase of PTS system [Pseudonocardia sp. Ae150A_Ps1]OLL80725.1 Phosphoenolpyruvate-protein phosphotransferase of PTS system [Pseudonocardia sp. Ae168_Ps1]OLL85148.1 Phosphoenolpyruvate-protein phosphotransferase of PTS system [Pseudonocardia sp. Ae263_Ps1]OLL94827.1 Phosphoenolpyruvate-protein phosphotransferase of PTS system [Pseudonocardia sp. Ae356_Ps1]
MPSTLNGIPASPGRAGGRVVRVAEPPGEPAAGPAPADPAAEAARIAPAVELVSERLTARAATVSGDAREVLEATVTMVGDPALLENAQNLVTGEGRPAARAVWEAAGQFAELLSSMGGYMAERARDIHDVRDRIVAELLGLPAPGVADLDAPAVLVAGDLAPADTAGLRPGVALALVTEQGGPTSHTAILARSLGIPAVVGCAGARALAEGTAVTVDGGTGEVAEVATLDEATAFASVASVQAGWDGTGRTADGHVVPLLANVGDGPGAAKGAADGAEGVGLFRTELAFLAAAEEPAEARQREVYAAVLSAFAGRPVTARTLDAGADKPLPFLSLDGEPNPALGVRGLRIARVPGNGDGVLDRQLAALAAAAKETGAELKVMAPMVATAEEARWFVERCRAHGIAQAGVMIEIPAAVLTADEIMAEVDFVSVGTNDLAQYLFAADRQSGPVAALNDPWQPALLRLIGLLGEASARTGTPVGVCGDAAADAALAPVLVGLGVASLSMGSGALAAVGAALGSVDLEQCRDRARAACAAADPIGARRAVSELGD